MIRYESLSLYIYIYVVYIYIYIYVIYIYTQEFCLFRLHGMARQLEEADRSRAEVVYIYIYIL